MNNGIIVLCVAFFVCYTYCLCYAFCSLFLDFVFSFACMFFCSFYIFCLFLATLIGENKRVFINVFLLVAKNNL